MISHWKCFPTDSKAVCVVLAAAATLASGFSTECLSLPPVQPRGRTFAWHGKVAGKRFVWEGGAIAVSSRGEPLPATLPVTVTLRRRGRHLEWKVGVSNRGSTPARVTLAVRLTCRKPTPHTFFDGLREEPIEGPPPANHSLRGTFPVSCVLFNGFGMALGLAPGELVSWFEHRLTLQGDGVQVQCSVRVAVDPGETVNHTFVVYGFRAPFGYRDALQVYYDEFPSRFRRLPGVDPRVDLNGATYNAWRANEPEMCRRMFAGWEWCYAPFRRTGDWYGRQDRWDYKPARPMAAWRAVDRKTFLAWRRKRFTRGARCDVAMLFYLPSCIWAETQLVKSDYPDAVVYRNGKPYELTTPWVTGHDNETMVFPWGNRLADDSRADMRRLVADLDIAGFAFDTADGGWPYRGPAIRRSPGRAWDEQGEFCDVSVAIAKLMDYVHTLRKDGRRMALVANPGAGTTFMLPFRADSAMLEKPPYRGVKSHLLPLRRLLGHKTLVWWDDWSAVRVLRWQEMSGTDILEALRGMRDYTLLASLYYGGIPTPRLCVGVPKLVKALPVIAELVRRGWQPTPGAVTDPPSELWVSRYGEGRRTFIAVCNQTAKRYRGELVVWDDYLEVPAPTFLDWEGRPVPQRRRRSATALPLDLPSRGWRVFRLAGPRPQTPRSVLEFPFEKAAVCLPADPTSADRYAAFRLQEYFRFYYAHVGPARKVLLPIVKAPKRKGGWRIFLGAGGPRREGETLFLPRAWSRLKLVLRDLDGKYPYYGRFPAGGEAKGEADLIRKAGIAGKRLE